MKKFGFSKKSDGEDDDRDRSGLFGRKKPAAQDENPYAQQPAEDPYARMTPYQQAKANLAAGPQVERPGSIGLPGGPTPRGRYGTPPPSYAGSPQVSGGYGPETFGTAGGYGSSRYDTGSTTYGSNDGFPASQTSSRLSSRGLGGYGGLGPTDDDPNRDSLLAGARQRPSGPPSYVSTAPSRNFPESGATNNSSHGEYGVRRELTAEEQENEEVENIINQGMQMKRDDVASLQRSTRIAREALNTATGTVAHLALQDDMLRQAEKNLLQADAQHKVAADKTRELKTLNRSMFAVHVSNPFTKGKRAAAMEEAMLRRHREERGLSESARREAFLANREAEQDFNQAMALGLKRPSAPNSQAAGARSGKYTFNEDDAEEEEIEAGIEAGLTELELLSRQLNKVARTSGKMVERQNEILLPNVHKLTEGLDEDITITRHQLSKMH